MQGGSGKRLTSIRKVFYGWVCQAEVDAGKPPGLRSSEAEWIRQLEAENRQAWRSNAIGKRLGLSCGRGRSLMYTSASTLARETSSRSARFLGRIRAHDRPAVPVMQPRRAVSFEEERARSGPGGIGLDSKSCFFAAANSGSGDAFNF